MIHSMGHVVGGALLVAGTTIGVGMLALPVATGSAGFFPSVGSYVFCYLFMLCTGLLLVEACLWMPRDTSFISMAEKLLGPGGKFVFWCMYLFLFLTVMVAHVAGGADVLRGFSRSLIPDWMAAIIYAVVFAPVVYMGTRFVDRMNMVLISCVALFYLAFLGTSLPSVNLSLLKYAKWENTFIAIPILFTAFSYHVIIPTLVTYLKRNVAKIRTAVILGSFIPFVVYLVWEFAILGVVPSEGPHGLIETAAQGKNAVEPLRYFVKRPIIYEIGKYFAFFAMTTSFIPLALSFFDFLADGLKWKKKGIHRVILCVAVFGMPLVITLKYPQIFLVALSYAGGISCAFLFGLMPPLLVWVGRYVKRLPREKKRLFGGKPLLVVLMVFSLLILMGQVLQQI